MRAPSEGVDESQRNFNNIRVRSFILNGAPKSRHSRTKLGTGSRLSTPNRTLDVSGARPQSGHLQISGGLGKRPMLAASPHASRAASSLWT
jgi:hypothetical protein